jgi:hypothetical protein
LGARLVITRLTPEQGSIMGSKRKRHKREVDDEVRRERWLWDSFFYTDRIPKSGKPHRDFLGRIGRPADHRPIPLKVPIRD